MPIGVITLSLIAVFLLFSATSVFISWKKEKSIFLRDFTFFLFGIFGASFCWAIGVVAAWLNLLSLDKIGFLHPLAILSGTIGLLYLSHLALTFVIPRAAKKILMAFIVLSFACSFVVWSNPPVPAISENGIVLWNIPFTPGVLTILLGLPYIILPVFSFFYLGIKGSEKIIRFRSLFIAIGISLYMIGGLAHNVVRTPSYYLFSDVITMIGAIFLLLSTYLKKFLRN